jgi:hypothetical protein
MRLHKIVDVSVPRYPVLRLTFDDGFSGEVDFTDVVGRGGVMTLLQDPAVFELVKIGDRGRSLGWVDAEGGDVDFCADALRFQAEEQVVLERAARYVEAKRTAAE